MNPTILGVIGPEFLNQVPTLVLTAGLRFRGLEFRGFVPTLTVRPLENQRACCEYTSTAPPYPGSV